jgi:glucan 1,3-beta-glucosidase
VRFATTLAARYKDAPAFLGIGLMNEPTNVDFEMAKRYYLEAYDKIRATGNDCILAVAPQLWAQSKESLPDFMRWPQYSNVWMEWHVYYKWGYENQNEYQILDAVRHFRDGHFDGWPGNYVFMGEWSLGNPDEKLFKDRGLMQQFASLQLQQYSEAHAGWAFWSWHHDDEKLPGTISGWSLRQLLREGIMTVPK